MTLELSTMVRRLQAQGLGWEDICYKLNINNPIVRATVRELTLFHVKHVQLEKPKREGRRAVS